jgi:hypothetical protein
MPRLIGNNGQYVCKICGHQFWSRCGIIPKKCTKCLRPEVVEVETYINLLLNGIVEQLIDQLPALIVKEMSKTNTVIPQQDVAQDVTMTLVEVRQPNSLLDKLAKAKDNSSKYES